MLRRYKEVSSLVASHLLPFSSAQLAKTSRAMLDAHAKLSSAVLESRNIILYGEMSCGKTTLVSELARNTQGGNRLPFAGLRAPYGEEGEFYAQVVQAALAQTPQGILLIEIGAADCFVNAGQVAAGLSRALLEPHKACCILEVEDGSWLKEMDVTIEAPAFAMRGDDLAPISQALAAALGKVMSPSALAELRARKFAGGFRDVANLVERACMFANGDVIQAADLPPAK